MITILTDKQARTCFEGAKIVKITPNSEDIIGITKLDVLLEDGKCLRFSGWPKLDHISCSYEYKTWREALEQPIKHFEPSIGINETCQTHITAHIFVFEDGHNVVLRWAYRSPRARERYTNIYLKEYRFYDDDSY